MLGSVIGHVWMLFIESSMNIKILRSLSPLSDVVNAVDCFDVWNHAFLVEVFFEGRDLQQYIAMEFPFDGCSARTDCSDSYWRGCKEIATKIGKCNCEKCMELDLRLEI